MEKHYEILYKGESGRAAHEFIIDCRPFKEKGIEVVDIAKRLMDYGYHAPTVSFPVAGTLMVEPTESESLIEINRFCDAMLQIADEINEIEKNRYPKENNVISNSPHTIQQLISDNWDYPYSRQKAAFPLKGDTKTKFWSSVSRIDNAFGDRNLVCSCTFYNDQIFNEKECA